MNEKEFAEHILSQMKKDTKIQQWYNNFMTHTQLSETEKRLVDAVNHQQLTLNQAIQLALFIGMTTLAEEASS